MKFIIHMLNIIIIVVTDGMGIDEFAFPWLEEALTVAGTGDIWVDADVSREGRRLILSKQISQQEQRGGVGVSGGCRERRQVLSELHSSLCGGKVGEPHHSL